MYILEMLVCHVSWLVIVYPSITIYMFNFFFNLTPVVVIPFVSGCNSPNISQPHLSLSTPPKSY